MTRVKTDGTKSETLYYYVTNLRGDVIGISNGDGVMRANYQYDAWGNLLSAVDNAGNTQVNQDHICWLNPLRYRGYAYDKETGLYYLQSRYYDPVICRFINGDQTVDTGAGLLGTNMFSYCDNDPVNLIDSSGCAPWYLLPFWGFVHNLVQNYYAKRYGLKTEYTTKKGGGRVDLFMPASKGDKARAWEVKSFGTSYAAALIQLTVYINQLGGLKKATYGYNLASAYLDCGLIWVRTYIYPLGIIYYDWGLTIKGYGLLALSVSAASAKLKQEVKALFKRLFGSCGSSQNGVSTCFTADTLIQTIDGEMPILNIREGDLVYSQNVENGELKYQKVINTYVNDTNELIIISIGGNVIRTTSEHPFYAIDIGWVSANKLVKGDKLLLSSGHSAIIESVESLLLNDPIKVYNFEVAEYHTYFISELAILVHNKCS